MGNFHVRLLLLGLFSSAALATKPLHRSAPGENLDPAINKVEAPLVNKLCDNDFRKLLDEELKLNVTSGGPGKIAQPPVDPPPSVTSGGPGKKTPPPPPVTSGGPGKVPSLSDAVKQQLGGLRFQSINAFKKPETKATVVRDSAQRPLYIEVLHDGFSALYPVKQGPTGRPYVSGLSVYLESLRGNLSENLCSGWR